MRSFLSAGLLGIQLLAAAHVASAQPATASGSGSSSASFTLAAVEVTGGRRYTPADVVRLSGLAAGRTVTQADFDAATKRMAESGLFKEISYRYATTAGRTTLTFAIDEADWTMPVVFDNFVWFKNDEIVQAVRQSLPSFDGTAPTLTGIPERITQALQTLLATRQIKGRVDFMPRASLQTGIESFVFSVKDPGVTVCSLRFTGTSAIKEAALASRLTIVGSDYSQSFVVSTSRGTLTDMYREKGHWRAAIGAPAVVLDEGQACRGAAVTIPVEEGTAYVTDRMAWSGNASIASSELDGLMPLKAGELASLSKLNEGLRRVRRAYEKQGYVLQNAKFTPRLDEGTRAVFEVQIEEGPQFRFGTLTFTGLPPDGAATLTKQWRLKTGDIFDATYPSEFYTKDILPRLRSGAQGPRLEIKPDEESRVVHINYVFGS